jgi:hypothetical protein
MRFFINGSLTDEYSRDRGPMPVTNDVLRIGHDVNFNARPHGAIDEVRIWNVARTEGEIAGMMNTPITSPMAGLVAVWSLDGSPEATVGGFGGADVGDTAYGSTLPDPNPCVYEYFMMSAAHAEGALGSTWFTDLTLYNRQSRDTFFKMFLLTQNTNNADVGWFGGDIPSRNSLEIEDVILTWFEEDNMSAAIRFCSDTPLLIDARTYNAPAKVAAPAKAGGTYGQGITAQLKSAAAQWTRSLIGLHENDQFRTNLAMLNTSSEATTVTVRMYTADRVWLGEKEFKLKKYGYLQRSRIFTKVTDDDVSNGIIEVWSDGSPILVSATVVDNVSGDGIFKLAR